MGKKDQFEEVIQNRPVSHAWSAAAYSPTLTSLAKSSLFLSTNYILCVVLKKYLWLNRIYQSTHILHGAFLILHRVLLLSQIVVLILHIAVLILDNSLLLSHIAVLTLHSVFFIVYSAPILYTIIVPVAWSIKVPLDALMCAPEKSAVKKGYSKIFCGNLNTFPVCFMVQK